MSFVSLGEFAVSRGGSVNPTKHQDEVFDLYSIPAYDNYKPEILAGREIGSSKKIVQPGDVLISRIVPHIRRVWVVGPNRGRRKIASGEWIIYRGNAFYPNYLRHCLLADFFHQQFMKTVSGVGGSLLRARPSEVEKIKIPLPPLPEQRRIAAILDKADAIRRKRQRAIELTEAFLRSAFLEMFGDPGLNSKQWKLMRMESAIREARCGPFGTALQKSEYVDSGVPVWGIDNVQPNRFVEPGSLYITLEKFKDLTAYETKPGDVLISRAGTVGRMCVARPNQSPSIIGTNLIRVSLHKEKMTPEYMTALFSFFPDRLDALKANGKDNAYSFMKTGVLKEIVVPMPPIDIQFQYVKLIAQVDATLQNHKKYNQLGDALFQSLTYRAFRGELTSEAAEEALKEAATG